MDGTEEEQVYFHMWKSIPSVSSGSDPNTMTILHYYRSLPSSMKSMAFPPAAPTPVSFPGKIQLAQPGSKTPFYVSQTGRRGTDTLLYIG